MGEAIVAEDQVRDWTSSSSCPQVAATEEKTKLEEAQRAALRERQAAGEDWQTKLFLHEVVLRSPH